MREQAQNIAKISCAAFGLNWPDVPLPDREGLISDIETALLDILFDCDY